MNRKTKEELATKYIEIEQQESVKRDQIKAKIAKLEKQYEDSLYRPILEELYQPEFGNYRDFVEGIWYELSQRKKKQLVLNQ